MEKLSCIFFGTPEFSVPSLKTLFDLDSIDLKYVVSMPDRPSGRGYELKSPEVVQFAKENNIPIHQTENINKDTEFLEKISDEGIQIFVVLAFAQFLSTDVLNIPKLGCYNIHTSLLPKYRGAAPIQYALLNGDTHTGVSIQKMVKKMDAGDIGLSQEVPITKGMTGGELYSVLMNQAAISLKKFLEELQSGDLKFQKQDDKDISFAPTLKKTDGFLNFKESTVKDIKNRICALDPWPGTYCKLNNKRLKVFEIEDSSEKLTPGQALIKNEQLLVGCLDRSIRLKEIQLEGKKRYFDKDLINGFKDNIIINKEE